MGPREVIPREYDSIESHAAEKKPGTPFAGPRFENLDERFWAEGSRATVGMVP